jgi:hypothetical protein
MAMTVVIHIAGSDTIMADLDEMPDPLASYVTCTNPRTRDGKPIVYIDPEAEQVLFPWARITFMEVLSSDEGPGDIESFFRD